MKELFVSDDGSVFDGEHNWPSLTKYLIDKGRDFAESLGITNVPKVSSLIMDGNKVIALLETGEKVTCHVSQEVTFALSQSDFGRKLGYDLHVFIDEKQDLLSAYGPDGWTLFPNLQDHVKISATLAQLLIGTNAVSYDW